MRILGLDPGTIRFGWGLIERSQARLSLVDAGVLVLGGDRPLALRLLEVDERLAALIAEHRPAVVAIEDVFFAKFANAAIKLGHVRGVALVSAARADLPIFEYPPALVKRTVVGRGRADKQQVGQLVRAILGLKEVPQVDAADALAVAITHAQAGRGARGPGVAGR